MPTSTKADVIRQAELDGIQQQFQRLAQRVERCRVRLVRGATVEKGKLRAEAEGPDHIQGPYPMLYFGGLTIE
jgi:hypothetical protein